MVCILDSGDSRLPKTSNSFLVAPKVISRTLARYSTIIEGSIANASVPLGLGLAGPGEATKLSIMFVLGEGDLEAADIVHNRFLDVHW